MFIPGPDAGFTNTEDKQKFPSSRADLFKEGGSEGLRGKAFQLAGEWMKSKWKT